MSSRTGKKSGCSAPHKTKNRPYDNRPGSGPGRTARRTSPDTNAVEVVLPDQPPRLTPGAAQALLRILIKARDRLADDAATEGAAE
jgi:hypothetical protein